MEEQKKPVAEKVVEQPKKKANKAKLRLEKRNAEMERLRLEAEKEAENQVDMGAVETEEIRKLIVPMNLRIKQISADGHWYRIKNRLEKCIEVNTRLFFFVAYTMPLLIN